MISLSKVAIILGSVSGLVFVNSHPADDVKTVYQTVTSYLTITAPVAASTAGEARAVNAPSDTSGSNGGGQKFSGDGTYYSPSVGTGSCGWLNSDSDKVVALNADQFGSPTNPNDSPFCGKKVEITGPKGTVEATIVDKCPVCVHGDLDMSPGTFNEIADAEAGRVPISWSFIGG